MFDLRLWMVLSLVLWIPLTYTHLLWPDTPALQMSNGIRRPTLKCLRSVKHHFVQ